MTVFAVGLAMVVAITGGIIVVYQLAAKPSCTGQATLRVAAAPEIVPALRLAGDSVTGHGESVNGACAGVEVVAADPADIAAALAVKESTTLTGVGLPAGNIAIPDVWVPDSSTWLARMSGVSPSFSFPEAPSLARSPVVVAMPEPVATKLGWPTAKLTWQALLTKVTTDTTLKIGTVEPSRDAAGLSGLLALGAAMNASPNGQAAATGALRSLAAGRSTLRQDLLARFPRSADPAAIASSLSAAALTEQAVVAYNAGKPPIRLAALYLEPPPLAMDYPFVVLPGADSGRAGIASRLLQAAKTEEFRRQLAADGIRGPDGRPGQGFALPTAAPEPSVTPAPTATERAAAAAAVQKTLATWHAVTLPARMLAIIDVSGSMLERVASAGGATRAQVTAEAARRGLGLFDDSWAVGLWTFSTNLVGTVDHQELLPIQPLSVQRTQMLATLGAIQPKPKGDTGLYDTILAAYQAVQKDWDPGRVNSIVLMTDGDNDDDNGVSLTQLQDKLKTLVDPKRPIQLIILGIGSSVNSDPLTSVTKITGGGVFVAEDPANIGEIFLKAISLRSGQAS